MKNKIFLTSMFAVMLAFPAYANLPYGVGVDNSVGTYGQGYIGTQVSAQDSTAISSADCDTSPLTDATNGSNNYGTYTLTAQWTPINYSVRYTPGTGCSGNGTTDTPVTYGTSYTVKNYSTASISAAAGYHLPTTVSWTGDWTNGTSSVAGTQTNSNYTPGAISYYIPGNLTLTVDCEANDYTVTYAPGTGCQGGTTDTSVTYGSSYTVKNYSTAGITAQSGYTLPTSVTWTGDWTNGTSSVAGTQTSSNYTPGAISYYVPNNLTLTSPDCTPNQYTVTYDCNGGTVDSSLVDSVDSNGHGIDNVTYNTTSYTFQHQSDLCTYANQTPGEFTCTHNADGTPWFVAQTWNIPDAVTCTAHWNATPYTITYDCGSLPDNGGNVNGGTFEDGTNNVHTVYNGTSNYNVLSNANGCGTGTQLDGYHFMGWKCDYNLGSGVATPNPSMTEYSVNWPTATTVSQTIATIGLSNNANCYAQWEANRVDLVYLKNDGDTAHYDDDSCQYGADTFTLPANPSKPGHTFTGWLVTEWDPNQQNSGNSN